MKNIFTLFIFLSITTTSFAQGSWLQRANFGGAARVTAVGFSIGSYGYIGTGFTGITTKDFWQYDPANDVWTQKANFGGTARRAAVGFSIGNKGYIGTGIDLNNTYTTDFWEYDPAANTWIAKANFGGIGRYYAAAFSIGTKGYIGTGMNGSVAMNDFWEYNQTTDTWTQKANFAGGARADAFGMTINGKGYIGCGRDFSGNTFYSSVYEYDPTGNTWTQKADFIGTPAAREGISTFVIGNYGYAGLGSTANFGTQYSDFYRYDPLTDTWSPIATFARTQRTNAASFSIGNFGYVGTGFSFNNLTFNFWRYDPCGGISTTITAMATSCYGGSDGTVNLTVSGGVPPLSYLWSNTSTTEDLTGVSAGNYSVIVTDNIGCTKTATVTVTQPTMLSGTITTVINASCNLLCDGQINISASGATPPYTYMWSSSVSSTTTATGLCAGIYSVTITDAKGCSVSIDTTITQPPPLMLVIDLACSNPPSNACTCDGYISLSAAGGTMPYTFTSSSGCNSFSCSFPCTGLCSGIPYLFTVTDANGCSDNDTVMFPPYPLTLTLTATPATCASCPDGNATAIPAGGNLPYSYSWSNGSSTSFATGLLPGTYTVCITDADNCIICDSVYVGFSVGINEYAEENDVSIFPNPSTGIFFMKAHEDIYEIAVMNILGEEIINTSETKNKKYKIINLVSAKNGIYFLKITTTNGILTKKIILRR